MSSIPKEQLAQIRGEMLQTLLRQVAALACSVGAAVVVARLLGPEGNGRCAASVMIALGLSQFLELGLPQANSHLLARSFSLRQAATANLAAWSTLSLVGLLGAGIAIRWYGQDLLPGVPIELQVLGLASFPLVLLQAMLVSMLRGLRDFRRYNRVLLVSPAATLVLVIFWCGTQGLGAAGALWAFLVGQLLGIGATLVSLRPHWVSATMETTALESYWRRCADFGLKSHGVACLSFLSERTGFFLVNLFLLPAAAGVYAIAAQISDRLLMLSLAASTVLLPRLSTLEDPAPRAALTARFAGLAMGLSALVCVLLAGLARPVIGLLFGDRYLEAVPVLQCLLVAVPAVNLARVLATDLAARGRPELNLHPAAGTTLLNVALGWMLIPHGGLMGGAVATTVGYCAGAMLTVWTYLRVTRSPQTAGSPDFEATVPVGSSNDRAD
ncbi:MAG: oligosaccharide flippase family protein [Armatimonadetes bacterium]|nr:oligosaccharide flippase family protein [Armatimonadota bacterium]